MRRIILKTVSRIGATRTVREFLWLPKELPWARYEAGRVWRWLEFAEIEQRFEWGRNNGLQYPMWINVAWADLTDNEMEELIGDT